MPFASTVPAEAFPPATPLTDQVTAPPPVTVAMKWTVCPGPAAAFCGLMVTEPDCCGVGGGWLGLVGFGGAGGTSEVRLDGAPPAQPASNTASKESPIYDLPAGRQAPLFVDIPVRPRTYKIPLGSTDASRDHLLRALSVFLKRQLGQRMTANCNNCLDSQCGLLPDFCSQLNYGFGVIVIKCSESRARSFA